MKLFEIRNLVADAEVKLVQGMLYRSTILYTTGISTEGMLYAGSEREAILKVFLTLKNQGVEEIIADISCEELNESI